MQDILPYPNINAKDDETRTKQINNYLLQLKEALEFEFMRLSSESLSAMNAVAKSIDNSNTQREDQITQVSSKVSSVSDGTMSAISQTADAIRTEVSRNYETKTNASEMYKNLSSSITQTEENINLEVSKKVNGDKIASTINQTAQEVKISAQKISLEGIITNNNGFEVDENGYVKMNGAELNGTFSQKDLNGLQSVKIENNQIDFHNWNGQGEHVGSICTVKDVSSDRVGIDMLAKEGSDITLSIRKGDRLIPIFQVNGDTYEETPPWIRNTANGTLFPNNSGGGIKVENGLITDWKLNTSSGTITIEGASDTVKIIVENGLIKSWSHE